MPILPPDTTAPYDTVESVLEVARVRLNDAIQTIGGEVLTDTAPFSQTVTNIAWRQLCLYLGNLGDTNFTDEVILFNCPVVGISDPAIMCYVSWTEYFNGASYYGPSTVPPGPVLPQDLLAPLKTWERTSGVNQSFDPGIMEFYMDGLPTIQKQIRNQRWEWRTNRLYFPGSQQIEDLKVRYIKNFGDFLTVGDVQWYQQPIPVPQCMDPLSWFIAAEMSEPRGDVSSQLRGNGEMAAAKIFNRQVRREQRTTSRRMSYTGRRSSRGCGYGYGNGSGNF